MRLVIVPTDKIVKVNGTECRAWLGKSEKGIECVLFVASVAVPEQLGQEEFQAALRDLPNPGREADFILREITHGGG